MGKKALLIPCRTMCSAPGRGLHGAQPLCPIHVPSNAQSHSSSLQTHWENPSGLFPSLKIAMFCNLHIFSMSWTSFAYPEAGRACGCNKKNPHQNTFCRRVESKRLKVWWCARKLCRTWPCCIPCPQPAPLGLWYPQA